MEITIHTQKEDLEVVVSLLLKSITVVVTVGGLSYELHANGAGRCLNTDEYITWTEGS